jgi:hypothetical protein
LKGDPRYPRVPRRIMDMDLDYSALITEYSPNLPAADSATLLHFRYQFPLTESPMYRAVTMLGRSAAWLVQ